MVSLLALSAGACSTIADLDPTGLLSDDSTEVADSQFPDDANPSQPPDAGTTPDLASLPPRPVAAPGAAQQQQQVAQAVTAQGAQAQYSADALRAGTEAAAPAPAAAQLPTAVAQAAPSAADAPPSASELPPSASDAPPSASDAPPSASPSGVAAAVPAVGPAAPRRVASAPAPAPMAPPAEAAPPAAAPAPMATASAAPVPGSQPAVPAVPAAGGNSRVAMLAPPVVSDAALGFKKSEAPALDPSISNWVSAPILARYRQTAAQAGAAGTKAAAVPAVADAPAVRGGRSSARAVGGPGMSGSVVANMDALSGAAIGSSAAYGGLAPTAVVFFPGDSTSLSPAARNQVRDAVSAFKATGGTGTVRVVGHASSRTANMPVERHLEVIFNKSQQRANAVAQALIRAGVPADKVLVEAVGDSQPVYYESMPKGEDGNRRAEIFVQG